MNRSHLNVQQVCVYFVEFLIEFNRKSHSFADSQDDLQIVWLRNNKEIPDNPDFRRDRDGNTFKLVVAEV